jgi:hypothetical protein
MTQDVLYEPSEAGVLPSLPLALLGETIRLETQPFEHCLVAVFAGHKGTDFGPVVSCLNEWIGYVVFTSLSIEFIVLFDDPEKYHNVLTTPVGFDLFVALHPELKRRVLSDGAIDESLQIGEINPLLGARPRKIHLIVHHIQWLIS